MIQAPGKHAYSNLIVLQESRETGTRENGKCLLESLNFVVTSSLAKVEILKCEITCFVKVSIFTGQALKVAHDSFLFCLLLDLVRLSFCFHVTLADNVLGLRSDGIV